MKTSNNSYYWFALFVLCFITYQQVIDNIRPNYSGNNLTVKYLLGIAPNFFPAIGIPALFVILIPQMKRTGKWFTENKHLTANIISLTGLISWEFIQSSSTKLHFDWNDILWTFIGALVFQLIWTFTPYFYKENHNVT
ncbi:MAG: hypothetical protein KA251_01800 [Saprospiraceae bacterium]|nr:hypothetical protein [Candidatus Vicinibacter affinis]MBP6173335.1 hypothetical protein [Saprospiraceae bacterium]MBK6823803.1 hypothetical protein [Candidatus Vicinibacter affinis]MBK7304450.1 hypothetical protein [Candidatus Vicinibacter affinis]MBK7697162.1 hypothetical protein [Candidatus Vicinibacter affinis]